MSPTAKAALCVIAAVAYFVMPIDLIPDFLLGLGQLDDLSLVAFAGRMVWQAVFPKALPG